MVLTLGRDAGGLVRIGIGVGVGGRRRQDEQHGVATVVDCVDVEV
jgi:hypothetical protein